MPRFSFPYVTLPSRHQWFVLFNFVQQKLQQARLQQVAGNLTFATVLALVPLTTIALAVFTMFPQFGTLHKMLEAYFAQVMMPKPIANTILGYLTAFADKATHLSVYSALGLLLGAMAMVQMMETSFNQIWQVRQQRPFISRYALYLVIAVLGPLVFGISLMMTSSLYIVSGGTWRHPSWLQAAWSTVLSIVWMLASFTLLYIVLPNRTVRWREAACGGLFAAIAFEIGKRIFAAFIAIVPTYRIIYGALAAVPIFLVWIYLSWLITLAGAAIAEAFHVVWYGRWRHQVTPGSVFLDAVCILRVLFNLRQAGDPTGIDELGIRAATGLGLDEIAERLETMQRVGWVGWDEKPASLYAKHLQRIRTQRAHRWVLLADPAQLTLAAVYRLFVFNAPDDTSLARRTKAAIECGLNDTLASYFLQGKKSV